jgi:hypothetical protein
MPEIRRVGRLVADLTRDRSMLQDVRKREG